MEVGIETKVLFLIAGIVIICYLICIIVASETGYWTRHLIPGEPTEKQKNPDD